MRPLAIQLGIVFCDEFEQSSNQILFDVVVYLISDLMIFQLICNDLIWLKIIQIKQSNKKKKMGYDD